MSEKEEVKAIAVLHQVLSLHDLHKQALTNEQRLEEDVEFFRKKKAEGQEQPCKLTHSLTQFGSYFETFVSGKLNVVSEKADAVSDLPSERAAGKRLFDYKKLRQTLVPRRSNPVAERLARMESFAEYGNKSDSEDSNYSTNSESSALSLRSGSTLGSD